MLLSLQSTNLSSRLLSDVHNLKLQRYQTALLGRHILHHDLAQRCLVLLQPQLTELSSGDA